MVTKRIECVELPHLVARLADTGYCLTIRNEFVNGSITDYFIITVQCSEEQYAFALEREPLWQNLCTMDGLVKAIRLLMPNATFHIEDGEIRIQTGLRQEQGYIRNL